MKKIVHAGHLGNSNFRCTRKEKINFSQPARKARVVKSRAKTSPANNSKSLDFGALISIREVIP
jgi:hypothetical protein